MRDLSEITDLPELSDGRLRLRALRPEHQPAVVAGLNDPECGRFLWKPPYPYTDADFDEFYSMQPTAWSEGRNAFWTITDAGDGSVLGAISIGLEEERETGEIGYWCGPWARGRGVMKAAVRLVRDWGFDALGLERIEITTHQDNIASQRVALGAGFTREGVMRGYLTARGRRTDDVLFAMLPGDPRPPAGERRPGDLGWPRLTDGRLVVRPYEADDAPAEQAICDQPEMAQWLHLVPSPYSLADAEEFIADSRRRLVAGDRARMAITDATSGETAGERQPGPLPGPAGGGDRLSRQTRVTPPRRGAGRRAARRRVGLRHARSRTTGDPHVPGQRGLAGACGQARLHAASACCAAFSRPSRARTVRGGSCRPRTAASRLAMTRCSSCACAPTRRRPSRWYNPSPRAASSVGRAGDF